MKTVTDAERLLDVRGLSVRFFGDEGIVTAVDDVSFALSLGETLCLLGEFRVWQDGYYAFADVAPAGNG